jgi:uncharacterized protein (DUF1810 family)
MSATGHNLERFVEAQGPVYGSVLGELTAGKKVSHWMWFVFPQLKGLGRSSIAKHFGIEGREEAAAYWRHPVLGPRLRECSELVLAVQGKDAHEIFGSPDDMKLKSCMTLFEAVARDEPVFGQVLEKYFGGRRDEVTVRLLLS